MTSSRTFLSNYTCYCYLGVRNWSECVTQAWDSRILNAWELACKTALVSKPSELLRWRGVNRYKFWTPFSSGFWKLTKICWYCATLWNKPIKSLGLKLNLFNPIIVSIKPRSALWTVLFVSSWWQKMGKDTRVLGSFTPFTVYNHAKHSDKQQSSM